LVLAAPLSGCASSPFAGFLATRIDNSARTAPSTAGTSPCPRREHVCVRRGPQGPCTCMRMSDVALQMGWDRSR
jgi:hypothetical protein